MTNDSQTDKFRDLLKGVRVGMLTSVTGSGELHSRPMAFQHDDQDDTSLWFIADLTSDKANEIQHDQHVNVSFARGDERWVSVSGSAQVVRDRQKLQQFWSPFAKAWFPDGPEDPKVGLLRVAVDTVEYWEANSPKPVRVLQQLAAAATGRQPDMGESGTLDLRSH